MSESPTGSSLPAGEQSDDALPEPHPELGIELLEYDETIPPRPEEEVADAGRAAPDPH
jgi:hypothetical protein